MKKGNLEKALLESKKAVEYLEQAKDYRQMVGSLNTVGICYLQMGKFREAEHHLRESIRLSKITRSATTRIQVLSNLGLALEKQKKWEEAYWILDEAYSLKDTVFNTQTEKEKLALEARFENQLKEKDIRLLRQEKQNQELTIGRQRLFTWGSGSLGLMALVLALVSYRNAQLRKKTNDLLRMEKTLEQRIRHRLEAENRQLLDDKLQARWEALKSQVNPHFLFNSLNSLSSLIRLDAGRAEQFVEELSGVYRYLLRSNENPFTPLREEMAFIRSYVHLLKTRFGEALQVEADFPSEALERQIPPLTLQLLVENAIKHNVVSPEAPLTIRIRLRDDGRLEIRNNLQRKTRGVVSHGVGLGHIQGQYERLHLPGPEIGEDDNGFWVAVVLA